MVDNVFLTEKRRAVLNGTSDLEGQALANEKYRIRKRAKMALSELEEVAQSIEIENRSVFEPEEFGRLLFWLYQDAGSVQNMTKPEGEWDPFKTYSEAHKQYANNLYVEVDKQLKKFDKPEGGF